VQPEVIIIFFAAFDNLSANVILTNQFVFKRSSLKLVDFPSSPWKIKEIFDFAGRTGLIDLKICESQGNGCLFFAFTQEQVGIS
jgi:hypothetical protein